MLYHGFYVKITSLRKIQKEKKDGSITLCDGFQIEIFSDRLEEIPVDVFRAAVGFEILRLFCKCWGKRKQRSFGKNQMRTAL